MSADQWELTFPAEPAAWVAGGEPFRCCYCGKMVEDGVGRWVAREPYVGPGQFMAVHRVECRRGHRLLNKLRGAL